MLVIGGTALQYREQMQHLTSYAELNDLPEVRLHANAGPAGRPCKPLCWRRTPALPLLLHWASIQDNDRASHVLMPQHSAQQAQPHAAVLVPGTLVPLLRQCVGLQTAPEPRPDSLAPFSSARMPS